MVKNSINKYFWYPLIALSSAAALFFGGDSLRIKWQKEQAENFKSLKERIAQEQGGIPSLEGRMFYSLPASPSQKDIMPEYLNALQENATNPYSQIADNFDYLPGMNDSTNKAPQILEQETPETLRTPSTNKLLESYAKIPKIRNNNPGNLRPVRDRKGKIIKWRGQIDVDSRGFCIFNSLENGLRAAGRNLQDYNKVYGRDTIREIIENWAPRIENDTERYIARVSQETGYHPNQPLNLRDKNVATNLIAAITKQEHGKYISKELVDKAISGIYN